MVLEARLIGVYVSTLILLSAGCFAQNGKITDEANVQNYVLTLRSAGESCYLDSKVDGKRSTSQLKIKPPCYFVRQGGQEPQSFSYKDVKIRSTILLVGSPISQEKKVKWDIKPDEFCGESRQAILINQSGLLVTEKILEGGVVCKDMGADEKDFWYFAH